MNVILKLCASRSKYKFVATYTVFCTEYVYKRLSRSLGSEEISSTRSL
jgi:hypothetical protein